MKKIIVNKEQNPTEVMSTMGALAGHEHLYVKIDDACFDTSIKHLFDFVKTGKMEMFRPCSVFYNKQRYKLSGNKSTQNKSGVDAVSGVYAITYIPEDVTYIGSSSNVNRRLAEHRSALRLTGGLDAGACFGDTNIDNYQFDVLEYCANYQDAENTYIETIPNVNFRGVGERYYKSTHGNKIIHKRPNYKQDIRVPQDIIDVRDRDIKVLDRDNKWVKINNIFKNDKHNSPFMMHIYYAEFDNCYCLTCTEDHPLWTGNSFIRADKLKIGDCLYRADGEKLPITDISWHWDIADSYDIGTVTGSFIGSDIIMHNCRTQNGADVNAKSCYDRTIHSIINGEKVVSNVLSAAQKDGRGNICPVTVIMPTLAMEAKQNVEEFMALLDKKIHEAKDMLLERFEWICSQTPAGAQFMYENNVMAGYVPEEGIRSALKHGTIVIGQLGLAETLQLLIGCDHTSPEGMELAKRIEQLFKDRCAQFKEQYKLNFGVYYSPAENLCYTAMQKFKAKYGVIKNVSDKEFFTNSMHVPVWTQVSPFEKIDIESQLTGYSSAGCITYVELDAACKYNIDGLESIVNYAMDKDVPYFAINVPNDQCMDCGYCDQMGDECPECKGHNIKRLRRVTGYLTNDYKTAFNKGKQQEVEMRTKHDKYMGKKDV